MEDIWASYYVSAKKHKIIYDRPTVFQLRNKHNLLKDFEDEYIGYKNNMYLIEEISKDPEKIHNFLPVKTSRAFEEWRRIIANYKF